MFDSYSEGYVLELDNKIASAIRYLKKKLGQGLTENVPNVIEENYRTESFAENILKANFAKTSSVSTIPFMKS